MSTWLKNGSFDFVFSAKEFVIHLCRVCEIQSDLCSAKIEEAVDINKELSRLEGCYIYVDTHFKRISESTINLMAWKVAIISNFEKKRFSP